MSMLTSRQVAALTYGATHDGCIPADTHSATVRSLVKRSMIDTQGMLTVDGYSAVGADMPSADASPVATNRPVAVPAVDPAVPARIAVTGAQISAVDRLIGGRQWDAHRAWVRQDSTGALVMLAVLGEAPTEADVSAALGEPVTMTRGRDWQGLVEYRLNRDESWCRGCRWINGHGRHCTTR